jgi:hypothetical protein
LRWDTTLRATLGLRLLEQNSALLADVNADDGDRAFSPGLISERLDAQSELALLRPDSPIGDAGIDISADGWYDAAYHQRNANHAPASFNPISVPNNEFPAAVRALDGDTVELLTAEIHDQVSLGSVPVTLRLGRQTLLWGESLFSPENGIAAGQAPVDEIKALSQPLAQAKELFLPVTQAVGSVAPWPGVTLQAYMQAEWRADRLPGADSFFSTSDILDAGGERLLAGSVTLLRTGDRRPDDFGQFGAAVKINTGLLDVGLYALRFDAKTPEIFIIPQTVASGSSASGSISGRYGLLYPRGIGLYGASFSLTCGASNLAGEVSLRDNMPLVSQLPPLSQPGGAFAAASPYARGTTLHGQVSSETSLAPGALWQAASIAAELTTNTVLSVTHDAGFLAPGRQKTASALHIVLAPQYFRVLPRLDLSIPIGVSYTYQGSSRVLADETAHAGTADIALDATWHAVWLAALSYTHFLGSAAHQPLADRDFVTLTVSRSF